MTLTTQTPRPSCRRHAGNSEHSASHPTAETHDSKQVSNLPTPRFTLSAEAALGPHLVHVEITGEARVHRQ